MLLSWNPDKLLAVTLVVNWVIFNLHMETICDAQLAISRQNLGLYLRVLSIRFWRMLSGMGIFLVSNP